MRLQNVYCRWCCIVCVMVGLPLAYQTTRRFCAQRTDGFTIGGISSHRAVNPRWDVHQLADFEQEELNSALSQQYRYLACGNQAFAFLSEDDRYVLKFFKQKLFQPPLMLRIMPSMFIAGRWLKKLRKKEDKLCRDFESYRIAFDELKEETGLIFVHLNHSDEIPQLVTIVDKIGIEHRIDLNQFDCIIQKKADLVYPTIDRLMLEGNVEGAKLALSSILQLFAVRCQKGIVDSDPDLDKNFGFIGMQAVQIDIGRFAHHVPSSSDLEPVPFPPIKESFKTWLLDHHPQLWEDFDREYQALRSCPSTELKF